MSFYHQSSANLNHESDSEYYTNPYIDSDGEIYYGDARPIAHIADWSAAKSIATELGDTGSDASDLEVKVHTSDITTLSADNYKVGTVKLAGIFSNQGIDSMNLPLDGEVQDDGHGKDPGSGVTKEELPAGLQSLESLIDPDALDSTSAASMEVAGDGSVMQAMGLEAEDTSLHQLYHDALD